MGALRRTTVNEATIRTEIRKALIFQLGFDAFHLPDMRMTLESRPDLLAYNAPLAIEVKKFEGLVRESPTFDVDKISNTQRKWLETWVMHRSNYAFLAIGTITPNPAFPVRKTWVIPWLDWSGFENELADRIPAEERRFGFTVTASQVDNRFHRYAMEGRPSAGYTFGIEHPIHHVPGGGLPNWMTHKEFGCLLFEERESKKKARAKQIENQKGESQ